MLILISNTLLYYSWNAEKGIKLLDRCWVSQANAKQRRGRAGRTQPGECYHLYTLDRFNNCSEYPTPEIQLTPLEHTIINLKVIINTYHIGRYLNECIVLCKMSNNC